MVNVRDVARAAGVSVGTVSNVLNRPERVSGEIVDRVNAAILELGFVRNDAARQLRMGHSRSIGFIVLDAANPFFTDVARGAEREAAGSGLAVLIGNSDQDPGRQARYLDLFEEQRVRGVLVSPIGDTTERLARLRERGTPAVLVDRRSESPELSSVSVDDVAGGRLATEHLLSTGRRRIAFVGGPLELGQVADRLTGARAAIASAPGASLEVLEIPQLTVIHGREIGAAIARRIPGQRPDAVFAANDLVAMGLLQAFMLAGTVRVPDEIALVGYDDIDFASAAVVPLTSVRQPREEIGRSAIDLVLASGDAAARHLVFEPELVVRSSTGAGPSLAGG